MPIVRPSDSSEYTPSNCVGAIYADSRLPTREIPPQCEALLGMMANIIAFHVDIWREVTEIREGE